MKKVFQATNLCRLRKNYRRIVATFITHLNSISVGMCQGYSAVLLPQLLNTSNIGSIHIDIEEASWIASLGALSNPIGALLSGILMDLCGRKTAVCYTSIPFIIGWTFIGLSNDLYSLCIGRCVSGLAIGMAWSSYVYVAEISSPSTRGLLSAIGPIFVSVGVLIVYTLGYVTSWQIIALVCAGVASITLLITTMVPESPSWLVTEGLLSDANDALIWFHTDQAAIATEMAYIVENATISRNTKPRTVKEMLLYCRRSVVWKPLTILLAFFVFQELSGIYIILYYAVDFFHSVGVFYNDYVASIMVGGLRFVMSILGALCIHKFSRKSMASVSGLLMAMSMATAAAYLHRFSETEDGGDRPTTWLPLLCVLVNVASSMLGLLQLPWLMIGELFPIAVRGTMGGITSSLGYLLIFITVKFYPMLKQTLLIDGVMLLFSISALFAAAFALCFLPETKNKSLSQIEATFTKSVTAESKKNLPSGHCR